MRVLADFDAELVLRLGGRSDITSTQRGFFLQDAARALASATEDPALQKEADETLSSGSDTLTPAVATDLWWATMIRNTTDAWLILPGDRQQIEYNAAKSSGPPRLYYWFGSKFKFDTLADTNKTIHLWYKRKPVEFTVSPETDSMFDPIILMKAAMIGYGTVRDFQQQAALRAEMQRYVQENNLPVNMAKLDDYRQGFRVRLQ